jgi:DNA repair exonuclease SbcCD ATPase subunit
MQKLLILAMILFTGVLFAQQTQDLGELAKKEKARREELAKQGKKSKTYTKEDIDRVKDKLALESKSAENASAAEGESESAQPASNVQDREERERQRQNTIADLQQQIDDLNSRKDDLQKEVDDQKSKANAGGPYSVNPAVNLDKARDMNDDIKDIEQQIKDLEERLANLKDEARSEGE